MTFRACLTLGVAVAVMVPMSASASWRGATPAAEAAVDPTVVSMEAVVKAAQIDPRRADHTLTAGAKSSVLAVERALQARGVLSARWVDGYFGTETVAAYTRYQVSLGYTGLAANGLPGEDSLTRLGQARFTVRRPIVPGARVHRDGVAINARTRSMLAKAERDLGRRLVLAQGSYNPGGDPTSAGTHDGGGVVDISVQGMSARTRIAVTRALRQVGFAAWVRNP